MMHMAMIFQWPKARGIMIYLIDDAHTTVENDGSMHNTGMSIHDMSALCCYKRLGPLFLHGDIFGKQVSNILLIIFRNLANTCLLLKHCPCSAV
jgi:hypothetical protein